jgi:hypothetical protein
VDVHFATQILQTKLLSLLLCIKTVAVIGQSNLGYVECSGLAPLAHVYPHIHCPHNSLHFTCCLAVQSFSSAVNMSGRAFSRYETVLAYPFSRQYLIISSKRFLLDSTIISIVCWQSIVIPSLNLPLYNSYNYRKRKIIFGLLLDSFDPPEFIPSLGTLFGISLGYVLSK